MNENCKSQEPAASQGRHQRKKLWEIGVFFQEELAIYIEYLRLHGKRESTIDTYGRFTRKLLDGFHSQGIRSLSEVKAADIYAAFEASDSKENFRSPAHSFLKYLYKKKMNEADLSLILPMVRRSKPVPSIYTKSETEGLLSSIDTTTIVGKRDYAMILLALRLGVRASDIVNLKACDIDYDAKTIAFVQIKTSVSNRLELLPEIEDALHAYKSIRPSTQGSEYIFLSSVAPFNPISSAAVGAAVSKYIKMAGINAGHRRRGSHAMRSTFASELVGEGVPYDVVRKILGHESQESTKRYVKFDFEMLRKSALEAPPPTGRLAEALNAAATGGAV